MHLELSDMRPGINGLRILRFPDVVNKTGLSKSAIYGRIRSSEFPVPVPLGPRAVGFVEHEVEGWLEQLIDHSRSHLIGTPRGAGQ
ncbi:MAG: prophage regulatory family protein [Thermoleophilia bacterium]|nr:prophage regulatory family protein [Thermoleophilia bacterium]